MIRPPKSRCEFARILSPPTQCCPHRNLRCVLDAYLVSVVHPVGGSECRNLQPYHVRTWTNMALHTALHSDYMAYRHCMPLHICMHMTCLWRARGWTAFSGTLWLSARFAPTHPSSSVRTPVFSGHTCGVSARLILRSLAFCWLSRPCRGSGVLPPMRMRCCPSPCHSVGPLTQHTCTPRAQGRLSEDYRANKKSKHDRSKQGGISGVFCESAPGYNGIGSRIAVPNSDLHTVNITLSRT